MLIQVCNRFAIENFEVLTGIKHVLISISTPGDEVPTLHDNPSRLATLRLKFCDVDRELPGYNDDSWAGRFTSEQAEDILRFIAQHRTTTPDVALVVHCDAGLSRSPGVAAAISRIVNGTDEQFFRSHFGLNRYVYRTLLETHHQLTNSTDAW